jgi:heat shock protein HslJ
MWLRSATLTVIVLLAIALGVDHAVAAQGASLPPEMTGVEWTLVSLQGAPGNVQDTTGKGMTIRFDPSGTVNGSGGCNTFRGGYTAGDGQKLTFTPLAATLMACEQGIMDREAAYLKALEGVSSYALDGASRLQLTFDNGQGILSYTRGQPTALPRTGGAGDSAALLAVFGVLCCIAGLLLYRWRPAPASADELTEQLTVRRR